MVSKRQKVAAIAVITIITISSLAIVLINHKPKPSEASAMILVADDVKASLGGDWQSGVQAIEPGINENGTSIARSGLNNGTMDLSIIEVHVFQNESACHETILTWISQDSFSACKSHIGNESYTDWNGSSNHIYLTFREGRAAVWILIGMYYPTEWLYDTAISFAQLQLEKIDCYFAG
jgi:hypothetical protein